MQPFERRNVSDLKVRCLWHQQITPLSKEYLRFTFTDQTRASTFPAEKPGGGSGLRAVLFSIGFPARAVPHRHTLFAQRASWTNATYSSV
jgi:hypothetical protein